MYASAGLGRWPSSNCEERCGRVAVGPGDRACDTGGEESWLVFLDSGQINFLTEREGEGAAVLNTLYS